MKTPVPVLQYFPGKKFRYRHLLPSSSPAPSLKSAAFPLPGKLFPLADSFHLQFCIHCRILPHCAEGIKQRRRTISNPSAFSYFEHSSDSFPSHPGNQCFTDNLTSAVDPPDRNHWCFRDDMISFSGRKKETFPKVNMRCSSNRSPSKKVEKSLPLTYMPFPHLIIAQASCKSQPAL